MKTGVIIGLAGLLVLLALAPAREATAQSKALSGRAQTMDANGNGVIDRDEARGPLDWEFEKADRDNSGTLDGAEIGAFFQARRAGGGAAGGPPKAGGGAAGKRQAGAAPGGGGKALSGRAKGMDANGNGVIDRDEARGPLAANFDKADKDKSGALDGAEIGAFFRGGGGRPPPVVVVDRVRKGPTSETYPVYGRLVARQMGVVAALIRGGVEEMRIQVGDRVARGDVLARLLSNTLDAERELKLAELVENTARVNTARAQLDLAVQALNRLKKLRRSAAFSQARYDDQANDVVRLKSALSEARARVQQSRAELTMAEINLYNATVRAPFGGVVSQRHADVGTFLNVGDRVVTLINDRALEVEAEVPSSRLGGLTDGTVVKVEFEDRRPFKATVRAVVPQENPLARTRTVRFKPDFGTSGNHIAVNQSVRLLIPTGPSRDLITVHKDAVLQRDGGPVVYVVKGTQPERRSIKLGQAVGGRFEVIEGLSPGDLVVIRGNERLRPGQRVRVRRGGSS